MEEVYRSCASVVVLRPSNGVYQVLLVHKPRKNDAWQLPQGGVEEGESLEEAASRELMEEAGISAEILSHSDHTYQYDFPPSFRKSHPDNVKGQHISYVFAQVGSDVAVQVDEHEIDTHVWAFAEDISKYIKRKEYLDKVLDLVAEAVNVIEKEV